MTRSGAPGRSTNATVAMTPHRARIPVPTSGDWWTGFATSVSQIESTTKQGAYRPRRRSTPTVAFTRTNSVSMNSHIERRNDDSSAVPMPNSDDHCSK